MFSVEILSKSGNYGIGWLLSVKEFQRKYSLKLDGLKKERKKKKFQELKIRTLP